MMRLTEKSADTVAYLLRIIIFLIFTGMTINHSHAMETEEAKKIFSKIYFYFHVALLDGSDDQQDFKKIYDTFMSNDAFIKVLQAMDKQALIKTLRYDLLGDLIKTKLSDKSEKIEAFFLRL